MKIDLFKKNLFSRSKKSKRSKSRERKHSRRSRSRSRSSSGERRHRRREERYEREQREERERQEREKEMERDRLRQIALEFKQSGAFSSIATQSQSFQGAFQQNQPTIPLLSTFPTFTSFPMMNTHVAPVVEMQPQPQPPKEKSQAFLEAIAASQRIVASKNFNEIFTCSNSNDSASNGPTYNSGSNSSE